MTTTQVDAAQIKNIASILKTVAHPTRLSIVHLLSNHEELPVKAICDKLETEQSLMSHHLSNLKLNGILSSRRQGKQIFYTLKLKDIVKIFECLENCKCNLNAF